MHKQLELGICLDHLDSVTQCSVGTLYNINDILLFMPEFIEITQAVTDLCTLICIFLCLWRLIRDSWWKCWIVHYTDIQCRYMKCFCTVYQYLNKMIKLLNLYGQLYILFHCNYIQIYLSGQTMGSFSPYFRFPHFTHCTHKSLYAHVFTQINCPVHITFTTMLHLTDIQNSTCDEIFILLIKVRTYHTKPEIDWFHWCSVVPAWVFGEKLSRNFCCGFYRTLIKCVILLAFILFYN